MSISACPEYQTNCYSITVIESFYLLEIEGYFQTYLCLPNTAYM